MKILLNILLFLVLHTSVQGQKMLREFRHLTNEHGLVGNSVNCIIQDHDGYVWVGTNSGLSQFDGYNFRNWKTFSSSIVNSIIVNSLAVDERNNIWIGTYGHGVWKYDKATRNFERIAASNHLLSRNIFALVIGENGKLYVGGDLGLDVLNSIYSESIQAVKITQLEDNFEQEFMVRSLYTIGDTLWIGTFNKSIISYQMNSGTYKIYYYNDDNACGSDVMDFVQDHTGRVWAGTWGNGLIWLNRETDRWVYFEQEIDSLFSISSRIITSIAAPNDKKLYLATWGNGVQILNANRTSSEHWTHSPRHKEGLNNNRIREVYVDSKQNVWLGTDWQGGINIHNISNKNLPHIEIPSNDLIEKPNISDFIFTDNDNMYVAGNFGLMQFSKSLKSSTPVNVLGSYKNPITACKLLPDGETFILSIPNKGIFLYNKASFEIKEIRGNEFVSENIEVSQIVVNKVTNTVWIVTKKNGLYAYSLKTNRMKLINRNYSITDISINENGDVWIATYSHGIMRFNRKNFSFESIYSQKYPAEHFERILASHNGNVYAFAPNIGIVRYSPETNVFSMCEIEKLPFRNVQKIFEDTHGNIFITSEKELFRMNFDSVSIKFKRLIPALNTEVLARKAYSVSNEGVVFIGSSSGFYFFNPSEIEFAEPVQSVTITDIVVNDRPICNNDSVTTPIEQLTDIRLSYYDNSFTIEFSSMDFLNSKSGKYFYKLQGFDKELKMCENGIHRATYTNIPNGKYSFLVKAVGNDNNEFTELAISIQTPFWKQWWFFLLAIAAIGVLIYRITILRERVLRKATEILKREIDKRTEEITTQNKELKHKNRELEIRSTLLEESISEKMEKQEEIQLQQEFLQEQNYSIEIQHRNILENIEYAKNIQDAVLLPAARLRTVFDNSFLLYKPRNVVSGDFYWVYETSNYKILAVADCTGHGVPGAFMSILGISLLKEVVPLNLGLTAAEMLDILNVEIQKALTREDNSATAADGMDMALCIFDSTTNSLNFAGANNPLYLIRKKRLIHYKPTKIPIGKHIIQDTFDNHFINIEKEDEIYLFSDGYADQFGGEGNKKFKTKAFKELLIEIADMPAHQKLEILSDRHESWKNATPDNDQTDDIIVVGIKF